MAKKREERGQSFNSLEALGSLVKPKPSHQSNRKENTNNMPKNFYSFLHKRNRFFEEDVIIGREKLKDHEKFNVKKITIENVVEDAGGRRPRPKSIEILGKFNNWENDDFYKKFANRHLENAKNICQQTSNQNFKPNWRLAIGLGTGSIFETSMSLHHVHGFPYLPSSGIKGVVRSYLITTVFGAEESAGSFEKDFPLVNAEFRALTQSADFCKLFGCPADASAVRFENGKPVYKKDKTGKDTKNYDYHKPTPVAKRDAKGKGQDNQGSIVFFDAYPITSPKDKIKADIMNPHYPDYYNDKNNKIAPTDYQQPKPIVFLTVEGLAFQFIVGLKKGSENFDVEIGKYKGKVLDVTVAVLKSALENHGIGAKTAVGYGYMENTP